jgi:hypothetical protein
MGLKRRLCVRGIGRGGWESNKRFYRIQRAYGVSAVRSGIRAVGVSLRFDQ